MSKTIFSDSAPDSAEKTRADNECARANGNAIQLAEMKARIRNFHSEVESVRFRTDEQQADPWMNNWFDYLLQGAVNSVIANDGDSDVVHVGDTPVVEFESAEVIKVPNPIAPELSVELPAPTENAPPSALLMNVDLAADFERDAEVDKFDTDSDNIDIV